MSEPITDKGLLDLETDIEYFSQKLAVSMAADPTGASSEQTAKLLALLEDARLAYMNARYPRPLLSIEEEMEALTHNPYKTEEHILKTLDIPKAMAPGPRNVLSVADKLWENVAKPLENAPSLNRFRKVAGEFCARFEIPEGLEWHLATAPVGVHFIGDDAYTFCIKTNSVRVEDADALASDELGARLAKKYFDLISFESKEISILGYRPVLYLYTVPFPSNRVVSNEGTYRFSEDRNFLMRYALVSTTVVE